MTLGYLRRKIKILPAIHGIKPLNNKYINRFDFLVQKKDPEPCLAKRERQIDRKGRLSHSTLDAIGRKNLHSCAVLKALVTGKGVGCLKERLKAAAVEPLQKTSNACTIRPCVCCCRW